MSQTVTLTLPDKLYQPVRRTAQATDQPMEAVLLTALESFLPPLDELPSDLADELAQMQTWDEEALRRVLLETVPVDQQQAIEALLQRNQAEGLNEVEREELESLQRTADRVMLRKAHAAVLLRFRGRRVPTLAELHQLTIAAE
ncbi:MAG: hypothetical protein ACLFTI_03525 [Anaerolineales bacterium]